MNIGFSLLGFTPGQLNGTMVGLEQSKLLSKIHKSTCVGPNTKIHKRRVPTDSQIPSYLDHFPEGTSTRPFVHFAQLHKSGKIFLTDDNNDDTHDNTELVH